MGMLRKAYNKLRGLSHDFRRAAFGPTLHDERGKDLVRSLPNLLDPYMRQSYGIFWSDCVEKPRGLYRLAQFMDAAETWLGHQYPSLMSSRIDALSSVTTVTYQIRALRLSYGAWFAMTEKEHNELAILTKGTLALTLVDILRAKVDANNILDLRQSTLPATNANSPEQELLIFLREAVDVLYSSLILQLKKERLFFNGNRVADNAPDNVPSLSRRSGPH